MRFRKLTILVIVILAMALITPAFAQMIGSAGDARKTFYSGRNSGYSFYWYNNYLTTGDLIRLKLIDSRMTTGASYISCLGGTGATEVFSIGELGAMTSTGTFDPAITGIAAAGDRGINLNITAGTAAITGTIDGVYIRASNSATAAADGSGTIRGAEISARNQTGGGDIAVLTGAYIGADVKNAAGTTIRGVEVTLDGAAGGTSTLAAGVEVFNNSSGTQTTSIAYDVNEGTASGRKAFTYDFRGQNGETIDNATNGTWAASGVLSANPRYATVVINTDASETLTAAQSGALVTCSNASGSTTITLPDPAAATIGVVYEIMQIANQDVIIVPTTANGNSLVAKGVATSDSVTLSHGTNKIGAAGKVIGISATQWFVMGYAETTLTVEAAD